eukprot:3514145-Rhodomonas_salina.1
MVASSNLGQHNQPLENSQALTGCHPYQVAGALPDLAGVALAPRFAGEVCTIMGGQFLPLALFSSVEVVLSTHSVLLFASR